MSDEKTKEDNIFCTPIKGEMSTALLLHEKVGYDVAVGMIIIRDEYSGHFFVKVRFVIGSRF